MWFKTNNRALKTAITVIAIVVIGLFATKEIRAQREFDRESAISKQQDEEYMEKNKPLFNCLLAADAMIKESSTDEERRAGVEAGDECYEVHG